MRCICTLVLFRDASAGDAAPPGDGGGDPLRTLTVTHGGKERRLAASMAPKPDRGGFVEMADGSGETLEGDIPQPEASSARQPLGCVAWRGVEGCNPEAAVAGADAASANALGAYRTSDALALDCDDPVSSGLAGWCSCEYGFRVREVGAGAAFFGAPWGQAREMSLVRSARVRISFDVRAWVSTLAQELTQIALTSAAMVRRTRPHHHLYFLYLSRTHAHHTHPPRLGAPTRHFVAARSAPASRLRRPSAPRRARAARSSRRRTRFGAEGLFRSSKFDRCYAEGRAIIKSKLVHRTVFKVPRSFLTTQCGRSWIIDSQVVAEFLHECPDLAFDFSPPRIMEALAANKPFAIFLLCDCDEDVRY